MDILKEAKNHLNTVSHLDYGDIWSEVVHKVREDLSSLTTEQEAILYCQGNRGIDHRAPVNPVLIQIDEKLLQREFPQFFAQIQATEDSALSRPDSLVGRNGHKVSNMSYWQLYVLLKCMSHVKNPQVVCELGGGYGLLGLIWLKNEICKPRLYIDVDIPESLFFAEVFLRSNLPDLKVLYVDTESTYTKLDPSSISQYSVILCPVEFAYALNNKVEDKQLSIDLVINVGSLQEMTETWVDFWMKWLDDISCRWFYSLNYFGQPADFMAESRNLWSPRLSSKWGIKSQTYNPTFISYQTQRNWAEILASKEDFKFDKDEVRLGYNCIKYRIVDGRSLLEAMDVIRLTMDEGIMSDLYHRCLADMPKLPKEAMWLKNHIGMGIQYHP